MIPYYQDEHVTLYHGDFRAILPEILEDGTVDFIFTDPPYGHNNNNNDLARRWEMALGLVKRGLAEPGEARPIANDDPASAAEMYSSVLCEAKRLLRPGACIAVCCSGGGPDPQFARWSLEMDSVIGFKHMVVWDKGGLGLGWHYRRCYEVVLIGQQPGAKCRWYGGQSVPNIIRATEGIRGIKPRSHQHPTEKPVALASWFITKHTQPGDLVLDPFCGSGSTLVAAKQAGCRAIGIEIDERWLEYAATRVSQGVLR
jgi:site-specific DNA-methyltransferase (adenine-specific)